MRFYLDPSAIAKTLLIEEHSAAFLQFLEEVDNDRHTIFSSIIGYTESRRTLARQLVPAAEITGMLEGIEFVALNSPIAVSAGAFPNAIHDAQSNTASLKSSDAIHIATAIQNRADRFVTYDRVQARYATELGLLVLSPGIGASST